MTFLNAVLHEVPRIATAFALPVAFVGLMGAIDFLTSHHPKYSPYRRAVVRWIRNVLRWRLKPESIGQLKPGWRPRDSGHLGRAWRKP